MVFSLTLTTCPLFLSSAVVLDACTVLPSATCCVLGVCVSELLDGKLSVAASTPNVLWRVLRRREKNAFLCLGVSVVLPVT